MEHCCLCGESETCQAAALCTGRCVSCYCNSRHSGLENSLDTRLQRQMCQGNGSVEGHQWSGRAHCVLPRCRSAPPGSCRPVPQVTLLQVQNSYPPSVDYAVVAYDIMAHWQQVHIVRGAATKAKGCCVSLSLILHAVCSHCAAVSCAAGTHQPVQDSQARTSACSTASSQASLTCCAAFAAAPAAAVAPPAEAVAPPGPADALAANSH
jgi:hypothetical protein